MDLTVVVENPSQTAQADMVQAENKKGSKNRKNNKFNKNKVKEAVATELEATNLSSTVIQPDAEIEPIIDKKAKNKAKKQAEEVEEKVETEQTVQAEETTSEEDKPKKTKRPNRGSKSKGRKTTSKKNSNDEE